MYLFLDSAKVVESGEIIGIFDLDKTTVKQDTRQFLQNAEKSGKAQTLSLSDLPLSFIVCEERTYISPVSLMTLTRRLRDD